MSFLEELGPPVVEVDEKSFSEKVKKISPFDFANSINFTKENLIVDEATEKEYSPFIVNRALGFSADTTIPANEMNSRPHIDNKMQYDFLCAVVRKSKRYSKWIKSDEENLEAIQQYFGYSFNKAKEALRILTSDDIEKIKLKLISSKGGKL
jgi:hypothetical protein